MEINSLHKLGCLLISFEKIQRNLTKFQGIVVFDETSHSTKSY